MTVHDRVWERTGRGWLVRLAGVAFDVMLLEFGSHRFDVTFRAVVVGSLNTAWEMPQGRDRPRTIEAMMSRADILVAAGADALDLGGPGVVGGDRIAASEELDCLAGVVEAVRERFGVPLWIATRHGAVAAACFVAGASVVDDHSGVSDAGLLSACAAGGASVVVARVPSAAHPSAPQASQTGRPSVPGGVRSDAAIGAMCNDLALAASRAVAAGIPAERIMLHPAQGPDGGETGVSAMLRASQLLADLGHRVVLSTGDNSSADTVSGTSGADRRGASVAAEALGVARGCRVIRTPDVRTGRRISEVLGAVLERR